MWVNNERQNPTARQILGCLFLSYCISLHPNLSFLNHSQLCVFSSVSTSNLVCDLTSGLFVCPLPWFSSSFITVPLGFAVEMWNKTEHRRGYNTSDVTAAKKVNSHVCPELDSTSRRTHYPNALRFARRWLRGMFVVTPQRMILHCRMTPTCVYSCLNPNKPPSATQSICSR